MAVNNSALLRSLYVLDDESNPSGSRSDKVYPSTILDQVFDDQTPDNKTLRTILEELRQEIMSGGIGNILFPVTSVNGMQGDVVITKYHIGLDQVDNTPDLLKPLSEPQRRAIEEMVPGLVPPPDLSDLYDHIGNSENPHNVTFDQVNQDGNADRFVQERIDKHNADPESHPDIRQLIETVTQNVTDNMDGVQDNIDHLHDLLVEHETSVEAHPKIFATKENKINKATDLYTLNHTLYPSTKAVADYVESELIRFKEESVDTLHRLMDFRVVNTRADLPVPDEDSFNKIYFIQYGETINNELAVCRVRGYNDYYWDITKLSTIVKYDPEYFRETTLGLSFNSDTVAEEVLNNPKVLLKYVGIMDSILKDRLSEYVTLEEYRDNDYLHDIKILPGTQAGTIKYTTNGTAGEMSYDVKVTDINSLAFLDKVTEDYIEDNAVMHNHIANRSIEHRHLQDQIVSAHNMRAPYKHIFGNFDDPGGMTVKAVPIEYVLTFFQDTITEYLESKGLDEWLKEELAYRILKYRFKVRDGYLWLQFPDDIDPERLQEIIQEYNKDILLEALEEAKKATMFGKVEIDHAKCKRNGNDCDHSTCTIEGNSTKLAIATINSAEFTPKDETEAWYAGIRVTCPYYEDGKCTKHGDDCSKCGVKYRFTDWNGDKRIYKFIDASNCTSDETEKGIGKFEFMITPDILRIPNTDGKVQYKLDFDWHEENRFTQTVIVNIDPDRIRLLRDNGELVWPIGQYASVQINHDYCDKTDEECDHTCCTIEGDKSPHTVATINEGIFSNQGGTWNPGITVRCPYAIFGGTMCSKYKDTSQCKFRCIGRGPKPNPEVLNLGADTCNESFGYGIIDVAFNVTIADLERAKETGNMVAYRMDCDWSDKQNCPQIIEAKVNPEKVMLYEKGEQKWPKKD